MSDIDPMPMSVDELKDLISSWLEADTEGLGAGEYPEEITEQYGEDPLAGVDHDTYQKALDQLHEEGVIPDDAYEQAQDQMEAGDDFSPGGIVLNITNIDNSIHTGDDFSGHIEQGDTTAVTNSGEGMAAGGDVYDSQVVTGDDNNTVGGDGDAGDGDHIDASGAHIDADEGSAISFGSGESSGYNTDDHSFTDNSTNTFEDNDTDNSTYEDNDPWTDNSTNTFEDNDPYTDNSTFEDNDSDDDNYEDNDTDNSSVEDNDPYTDNSTFEDNDQVNVEVTDDYSADYDGGDFKAEVEDYGDDTVDDDYDVD